MNKDVSQFVRQQAQRGWIARRITGGGHMQMVWPGGGLVTFSCTPSDHRTLRNTAATMRRIERLNPLDGEQTA